jgi:hypothetical protein
MWTFFAGERSRCGSAEGGEKLRKTNDQKILGSLSSPGKILKNIFVIKDDHKKFLMLPRLLSVSVQVWRKKGDSR